MDPFARLPGHCPATWAVIAANALTVVVAFVGGGALWWPLVFHTSTWTATPWSPLTYPLVGAGGILWVLLGGFMLWLFGGSLERSWGLRGYLVFLALVSAATALGLWVGSFLTGRGAFLAGLGMPLAAAVVAWAAINPRERLLLYCVIPIEARWLAIGSLILVFFSFPFPLGLFALAGGGAGWWYVRSGRYATLRPARQRPGAHLTLNPLALYRRWKWKRQFTRLMRNASPQDDADRGRLP